MRNSISLWFLLCFTCQVALASQPIDKIVVFGDSLSDTGNLYAQTKTAHAVVPTVPIVPVKPPYWNGRFSNQKNWIDYLQQALDVDVSNYAMGGSWVESRAYSHQDYPMSLYTQVQYYKSLSWWDRNTKKHLYVLFAGGNDYITRRRENVEAVTTRVIAGLRKEVESLIKWGGKYFMLATLPNLSSSPFAHYPDFLKKNGEDWGALLFRFETAHNSKLKDLVDELRYQYPDKVFLLVPASQLFDDIITAPQNFGFTHGVVACYPGSNGYSKQRQDTNEKSALPASRLNLKENWLLARAAGTASAPAGKGGELPLGIPPCSDPEHYVFWDLVHPTSHMHKLMAREATKVLLAAGLPVPHSI